MQVLNIDTTAHCTPSQSAPTVLKPKGRVVLPDASNAGHVLTNAAPRDPKVTNSERIAIPDTPMGQLTPQQKRRLTHRYTEAHPPSISVEAAEGGGGGLL